MTFDHWINEIEGYTVRHERILLELLSNDIIKLKEEL
jgi:hypothetical protein